MNISKNLLSKIYDKMWNDFKIGLSDAQNIISIMIKENYFGLNITNENDIDKFFKNILHEYIFPKGLSRFKVYDQKFLDENSIILKKIMDIPNGWGCKLYYDSMNNLYWEDNYEEVLEDEDCHYVDPKNNIQKLTIYFQLKMISYH